MLGERRNRNHSYKFPIQFHVTLAHCVGRRATIGVYNLDNITGFKISTFMYTIHQNWIENVETAFSYFHLISSQKKYTIAYQIVKQNFSFIYFCFALDKGV